MMDKIKAGYDKAKKVVEGIKKTLEKIKKGVKFAASTVGQIVIILLLVIFLIICIVALVRAIADGPIGKFFGFEKPSISTTDDYQYLVSSIGSAGYDTMISEKTWQEFSAFEYAVLMDAAEYIAHGQTKMQNGTAKEGEDYEKIKLVYEENSNGSDPAVRDINGNQIEVESYKYLPLLPVIADYDISTATLKGWRDAVVAGQNSARFGLSDYKEVEGARGRYTDYGGNKEVTPPIITYEFVGSEFDRATGSYVPYIHIYKDDIQYTYYTVNPGDSKKEDYLDDGKYGKNSDNGGVIILQDGGKDNFLYPNSASNIDDIQLMAINYDLNALNGFVAFSDVKVEQGGYAERNYTDVSDTWPVAESGFGTSLYYSGGKTTVAYKIPFKMLVDRYLPRASLLTTWYMLKDTDLAANEDLNKPADPLVNNSFAINDLMSDIKNIYNYYCLYEDITYEDAEIPAYGNGKREPVIPSSVLEDGTSGEVVEAVVYYDSDGSVIRKENGEATKRNENILFDTDNTRTFIQFGQAGIEANRFSVFDDYDCRKIAGGPSAPIDVTNYNSPYGNTDNGELVPVVTDLLYDSAYIMEGFTVKFKYECSKWGAYGEPLYTPYKANVVSSHFGASMQLVHSSQTCETCKNLRNAYKNTGTVKYKFHDFAASPATGEVVLRVKKCEKISVYPEIEIPYNPNGTDDFSTLVHGLAITSGEREMVAEINANPATTTPAGHPLNTNDRIFADYTYQYPDVAPESKVSNGEKIWAAKPLKDPDDYKKSRAFYTFSGDLLKTTLSEATIMDHFKNNIDDNIGELTVGNTSDPYNTSLLAKAVRQIVEKHRDDNYSGYEINDGYLKYLHYGNTPTYRNDVFFDLEEQEIMLTMGVPQKRMAVMLIMSGESWSKSANYSIDIVNNSFKHDSWQYVIPHSFFGFGVRKFNTDENAIYRTDVYTKYFSDPDDREPAIKESDVIEMMMNWENIGNAGDQTAYVYMRDLYRLIMHIRDEGGMGSNKTAYSYLYLSDSIWNFRDGITEEAFWSERLAAEVSGPDALTAEEQKKIIVKKNEISWQIVEYDEYEECKFNDTYGIYALFPFGSIYTRAWYMNRAIQDEEFDHGGYKIGHNGADWYSRRISAGILENKDYKIEDNLDPDSGGKSLEEKSMFERIYQYELKRMTMNNIMKDNYQNNGKRASAFRNAFVLGKESFEYGGSGVSQAYTEAKKELDNTLQEYTTRSPIVSVAPGLVVGSEYNCYSGFVARVAHLKSGDATKSAYVHMKRWPEVQVGDMAGAGTLVGYEGTTGNSGGPHLHMSLNVEGEGFASPARYMGPVFTPFYYEEKVQEILNEIQSGTDQRLWYNKDKSLILASEYYSLERTIVMDEEAAAGRTPLAAAGEGSSIDEAISLNSVGLFINEANNEYVFPNETDSGEFILLSGGSEIVFSIGDPPKYYKATVIAKSDYSFEEDIYGGSGGGNVITPDEYNKILGELKASIKNKTGAEPLSDYWIQIAGREEYDIEDLAPLAMVKVKIKMEKVKGQRGEYAIVPIVWGNNIPTEPLIPDYSLGFDATILNAQIMYDPKYAGTGGNSGIPLNTEKERLFNTYNQDGKQISIPVDWPTVKWGMDLPADKRISGDITAPPYLFTITSRLEQIYQVPPEVKMYECDIDNPDVIPFYDGQFTADPSFGAPAGQLHSDTVAFLEALKRNGFDPDDEITEEMLEKVAINGYTSSDTVIINAITRAEKTLIEFGYGEFMSYDTQGNLNVNSPAQGPFNAGTIYQWNDFVQYGYKDNAKAVGGKAINTFATKYNLDVGFLRGIATCESGFSPSIESYKLIGPKDDTLEEIYRKPNYNHSDGMICVIYWRGEWRALRRAQGLTQITPGNAFNKWYPLGGVEKVVRSLRTPALNVDYAGERLSRTVATMNSRPSEGPYATWEDEIQAAANTAFWQGLEKYTRTDAETLIKYSFAAEMYNKGNIDSFAKRRGIYQAKIDFNLIMQDIENRTPSASHKYVDYGNGDGTYDETVHSQDNGYSEKMMNYYISLALANYIGDRDEGWE